MSEQLVSELVNSFYLVFHLCSVRLAGVDMVVAWDALGCVTLTSIQVTREALFSSSLL